VTPGQRHSCLAFFLGYWFSGFSFCLGVSCADRSFRLVGSIRCGFLLLGCCSYCFSSRGFVAVEFFGSPFSALSTDIFFFVCVYTLIVPACV